MTPSSARLHVLLASENDFALVIRRGPTKQVCTLGWNRANDSFQLGQWLKGRIDEHSCDLSHDGRHFLYHASKFRLPQGELESYTVVSRAPYLKALHFWSPKQWTYGGAFLDNERLFVKTNKPTPDVRRLPHFSHVDEAPELSFPQWHDSNQWSRARDGWIMPPDYDGRRKLFHKTLGEWTLAFFIYHWETRKPDFYELRHSASNEVISSGEWNWADFDAPRKRLCFARDGQLWALDLKPNATEKLLHDFNAMTFEPIAAPY